jgi:predicted metal-binding membrane protein
MARDMYGAMIGPSAWTMTADWDARHVLLLFAMWAAMMTAMMLPSASPLVLLYAGALRTKGDARVRQQDLRARRRLRACMGAVQRHGYAFAADVGEAVPSSRR